MREQKRYLYVGVNGMLDSRICLEDVPCTIYTRLIADEGKILTNGKTKKCRLDIYDGEDKTIWSEIPIGQE